MGIDLNGVKSGPNLMEWNHRGPCPRGLTCQIDALPKLLIRLLGSKCVHFDTLRRQLDAKLGSWSILLELKFRPERVCENIQQLSAVYLGSSFLHLADDCAY